MQYEVLYSPLEKLYQMPPSLFLSANSEIKTRANKRSVCSRFRLPRWNFHLQNSTPFSNHSNFLLQNVGTLWPSTLQQINNHDHCRMNKRKYHLRKEIRVDIFDETPRRVSTRWQLRCMGHDGQKISVRNRMRYIVWLNCAFTKVIAYHW